MTDCLFCSILARKAPASFVAEDPATAAFLDLYPVNPGHALVVPKTHVRDLSDCPPDVARALMAAAQRLAPALVEVTSAEGFNVWTANGAAAGQEVFHLHLHVLPRFADDTFGLRFPKGYPRAAARDALDAMAVRVRDRLAR